jgi:L-2-hydroxyglutarate oxidase LhgO
MGCCDSRGCETLIAPTSPPIAQVSAVGIHGVPGLVNLYGIESPGLTASLPRADEVVEQLAG